MTKFAFQFLNGVGDYITLKDVLDPDGRPDWDKMTDDEILTKVHVIYICKNYKVSHSQFMNARN